MKQVATKVNTQEFYPYLVPRITKIYWEFNTFDIPYLHILNILSISREKKNKQVISTNIRLQKEMLRNYLSSATQRNCLFNFPTLRWDLVPIRLRPNSCADGNKLSCLICTIVVVVVWSWNFGFKTYVPTQV